MLDEGHGRGFDGFLIGVFGNHETVEQLAVHLHNEFDLIAHERFRIVGWPVGFREKRGLAEESRSHAGVEFFC